MSVRLLDQHASAPLDRLLGGQLREVDRIFREQLASNLPTVNLLCAHVERYQGKMLRPMLTLLSGLAAHEQIARTEPADWSRLFTRDHLIIAAVTEMIHMATLVHDDVLDDASMRRNGSTVSFLHGNEAAVLLGDYLISNAFHLCSTMGRPDLNERIGRTTNELCAGELLQVHHRNNFSIDEPTYFAIIERKTASLIGLCCRLGAEESKGDPQTVEALSIFGGRLGIAFQIQDDLLDLVGEESVVGKSLGQDLNKGKLTLPMILFFTQATPVQREEMLDGLSCWAPRCRSSEVHRRLLESGAVDEARRVSSELIDEAHAQLEFVPPSPVRDLLSELALTVISRRF